MNGVYANVDNLDIAQEAQCQNILDKLQANTSQ